jgi:hypothetical protein
MDFLATIRSLSCPRKEKRQHFTTPWGTFMYAKMSFGLMNAGAAFQRAMDIAFIREKDKFVVMYLDDIKSSLDLIKSIVSSKKSLLEMQNVWSFPES